MEVHNALQNLRKNPGPQSVSSCFVLQNFSSCMLLLKCFSISVNGDIFRTPTKMGQKKNIFMLLGTWNNEHTSYSSHWCSAYSTDRQHYVQRPKMFTKLMAQATLASLAMWFFLKNHTHVRSKRRVPNYKYNPNLCGHFPCQVAVYSL